MDLRIAWRNLWRNSRRSALTILAIAFACAVLVFSASWQEGTYEVMIEAAVMSRTGHFQVQAEGYNKKRELRMDVHHPDAVGRILDATPGIHAWTQRATSFALLSSDERTYGGLVLGLDPQREKRTSSLESTLRQGRFLDDTNAYEALAGSLLARNLRIAPGDEIVLLGQARDGSVAATVLTLAGIVESGQEQLDRATLYIPLGAFQETFAMNGGVNEIVVVADSLAKAPETQQAVQTALDANPGTKGLVTLTWDELAPGLKQAIQLDMGNAVIMYFLLTVIVAFSIWNTFLMAVFERTREFGVLMALGTTPARLIRLLLLESLALTLIGMALGVVGGCLWAYWYEIHGFPMGEAAGMLAKYGLPERLYPKLTLTAAWAGPAGVFVITMVSALYPALRVRRFTPVQAMHAT
ncbi:MAG: FtsX-like permease family protein [Desulfovibrionaceae bacterium]